MTIERLIRSLEEAHTAFEQAKKEKRGLTQEELQNHVYPALEGLRGIRIAHPSEVQKQPEDFFTEQPAIQQGNVSKKVGSQKDQEDVHRWGVRIRNTLEQSTLKQRSAFLRVINRAHDRLSE